MVLTLTSTTSDGTPNDHVALLGLVTQTVSLVGPRRTVDLGDAVALAVLPGADAEEESEGVALLVTPQLFHVLVAAHGWLVSWFG